MFQRLLQLPENENFFVFGPRGAGKTTLLKNSPWFEDALYINLLLAKDEGRFARTPDDLLSIVKALPSDKKHVIIDEVQKLPKLLDLVHELIETTDKKFVLTGSSARKLKHGGANLLAGRAFVYNLHPFTFIEVKEQFELQNALRFGMLPKIFEYNTNESRQQYLQAYASTYLKEEIQLEQVVRALDPFRHFLEVAAQSNGKMINFSNIARDVGSTDNTVNKYFSILEDTLIGFFLQPFQHSFRKRLSQTPKFYFFDPGVVRALAGRLSVPLTESTHGFGEAFEHFIILQCYQLASYYYSEYRFSYLRTKDDAEIDLVVERPGQRPLFIEIKSSEQVDSTQLRTLRSLSQDFGDCEAVCFSRDPYLKELDGIKVYPWMEGVKTYFLPGKQEYEV